MRTPPLRPMTEADIDPAVDAILADDWGDRRTWFKFALGHPSCHVFVAEDHAGGIVGTGVATVHGRVGWIGTIWVASSHRSQGIGRALTEAPIAAAEAAGCRTLVLVATERGRPLYERLGFTVQTWYRTFEAPGLGGTPAGAAEDGRMRPFRADDLPAMIDLDRAATGEDRARIIAALARPDGTLVLDGGPVGLRGFVVRGPWGGGATVAPDPDDAMAILTTRRAAYPPERRVRCGILIDNAAGAARLEADGWTEAWRAPRLVRGDPIDWRPEHLWGQFNHAIG